MIGNYPVIEPIDKSHFNLQCIYAHGKAEHILGTDLLSSNRKVYEDTDEVSICYLYDEKHDEYHEALMFYWEYGSGLVKGLVVLIDDLPAIKHAYYCSASKARHI